jgi:hypothetical protein
MFNMILSTVLTFENNVKTRTGISPNLVHWGLDFHARDDRRSTHVRENLKTQGQIMQLHSLWYLREGLHIYIQIHPCIHTYIHTYTYVHVQVIQAMNSHARLEQMHAYIHTCIHAYMHVHMQVIQAMNLHARLEQR